MILLDWPDFCEECLDVSPSEDLSKITSEMFRIMISKRGIGLAAPQVGIYKRFFIMYIGAIKRIVINPKITMRYNHTVSNESCLSFPGVTIQIDRATEVDVIYTNENGKEIKEKLKDSEAICFQHELDHLNGVTIISRLSEPLQEAFRRKFKRDV